MLSKTLAAAAIALALAAPAAPTVAGPAPDARAAPGVVGTWKGKVYNQDGPAGYTATIHLTRTRGKYRATVRYTQLSPTKWIYRGRDGQWLRFREIPKSSSGPGGVGIKVKRSGAKLLVRYRVPGSGYRGHVNAHRLR